MPSMLHEALLLLFRNRPTLAAEVLRDTLRVPVPAFVEARVESADLTDVVPRERRADQVVVLYKETASAPAPALSIVVEAQIQPPDEDKRFAWPGYVTGAFARYRCHACLLVVTTDPAVARRSAKPIEIGPGHVFTPFVLGPGAVPVITEPTQARAMPELAVLSVMAHGQSEAGLDVAMAALAGAAGLDEESATIYEHVVLSCVSAAAKRALEEMMASGNFEIQNEFIRKNVAYGEAKGEAKAKAADVLTVLEARGLAIPDDVRQRVTQSRDVGELDLWLRRAAVVGSARDIFNA